MYRREKRLTSCVEDSARARGFFVCLDVGFRVDLCCRGREKGVAVCFEQGKRLYIHIKRH